MAAAVADSDDNYILYSAERTLSFDDLFDELSIPLALFSTEPSGLQAIVRYLHEAGHLSFSDIARLLNRSVKTIWTSYHQAKDLDFSFAEEGLRIPVATFADRSLSVLEHLVVHLATKGFSNADTARLLNLDPRTTWTATKRASLKGGGSR